MPGDPTETIRKALPQPLAHCKAHTSGPGVEATRESSFRICIR